MRSMPSAVDAAKRALVTLVRTLAATYGVAVDVARDSSDRDLTVAVRRVALHAHPDRKGDGPSCASPSRRAGVLEERERESVCVCVCV